MSMMTERRRCGSNHCIRDMDTGMKKWDAGTVAGVTALIHGKTGPPVAMYIVQPIGSQCYIVR
jgi:hypothetical protein